MELRRIKLFEDFEDGFSDFTKELFDLTSKFGVHINMPQEKRLDLDIYNRIIDRLHFKGLKCDLGGEIWDLILTVYHSDLSVEQLWNLFPDSPRDLRTFYPTADRITFWPYERTVRDKIDEYTLYVGPENNLYKSI